MVIGQLESALHFGILTTGALLISLDRRLLLAQSIVWTAWLSAVCIVWLPQGRGLSVLVIALISLAGGLLLRRVRIASIERVADLEHRLEQTTRERELAIQRAQEAEKLESLGIMAAGVAHDYNNLLVGVVGGTDIATHAQDSIQRQEGLEMVRVSAQALRGLSAQLLDVAGGRPIHKQALDLRKVVFDATKTLTLDAHSRQRVRLSQAAGPANIYGELESMQRVVLNLLNNALHFASAAPGAVHIGVALHATPNQVQLWVEDDGPGVPDELASRIFDPFFSTRQDGKGLGLATVRTIVNRHDGEVRVRNSERGARFEITLPALAQQPVSDLSPNVSTPPVVALAAAKDWDYRTVLLVDDEAHVRTVAISMLKQLGWEVIQADSGEAAVELVLGNQRPPAFAIVDAVMPGMDGLRTIEQLRQIESGLPVVLCSGYHGLIRQSDLPAGVVFLAKPFDSQQLDTAIQRVLGERRLRQQR